MNNTPATTTMRLGFTLACLCMLMLASGCESTPKTSGNSATEQLNNGLNAYRAGNEAQAMTILSPLTSSSDGDVAGPSNAVLGLIYAKRAQHDRAIGYFQSAVTKLHGEDLAQAYYHLGMTEQKLGRWGSARSHLSLAISTSRDGRFRESVRQAMGTTAFTLQFGAYSSQGNAEQRARDVRTALAALRIEPQVITTNINGRVLYVVQAGEFGSYASALEARTKLGRKDVVVTQADH